MNGQIQESFENQIKNVTKDENEKKFKLIKEFRGQFKSSYKQNRYIFCFEQDFYLVFSVGKYLASFYSLQQRDQKCEVNPLVVWLTIVGMYEFFNSIRYLAVRYSLQMNSKDIFLLVLPDILIKTSNETMNLSSMQKRNRRAQIKILIKMKLSTYEISQQELIVEPPFTIYEIIHQTEVLNKYTIIMKLYNQFSIYLIFTGGNVAYFQSDSNVCDDNLNNVTYWIFIFSISLYQIWVSYYFHDLIYVNYNIHIFIQVHFQNYQQKSNLSNSFCYFILEQNQKMRIFHYSTSIEPSILQCNICMCDYAENDKIIQLPSSNIHHSQDHCFQQQILIKQQCSIYRKFL
ncbi:unnamed protein product [Paramecium sonneborni]|uniref:Transmembrane protein n=1 Tax=Paramecium sonneborni TaxID=65129 RepID=A0A8S1KLA1_9CILI|nr:unnamed protein product [Paramecium sonneborni]